MNRYVIIGGGVAGTTAAQELRKLDPESQITLISEESHALYSRVLLPHYLKEKVPRERVFLKKEAWYEEQSIEWLRGESVTKLDTKNKFVAVTNGREYEYDKCLIASGGEPRTADQDLRGVSYFRTLDDTDHLLQLYKETNHKHAVVYGGGFIACEYIDMFKHWNIPTTLIMRGSHFWTKILNENAGELINKHITNAGVTLLNNEPLQETFGNKQLEGVKTQSKTIECSLLGIGIGMQTDFSWMEDSGIKTNTGVLTNEYLETSVSDVFSAGDITEFNDVTIGRHLHIGNWMNAMSQGRLAAKNMTGEKTPFKLVSSYATNVLDLEIIFIGDTSKEHADNIKEIGSVDSGGITQIFERGGVIVGGVTIGRNTDRKPITEAIKNKTTFSDLQIS